MQKLLILFLSIFLFYSCQDTKTAPKPKAVAEEIDLTNFKKENVEFLNGLLYVPSNYERLYGSQFKSALNDSKEAYKFKENLKSIIGRVEAKEEGFAIYADRATPQNCIWVQKKKFVDFEKTDASKYIGIMEESFKNMRDGYGFKFERIENRILKTQAAKILKLKYKVTSEGKTIYETQYIITTHKKTFAVNVRNAGEEDFEDVMKKMVINKY